MNAEFNWWLLIVGLVIGAGLVWLVLADSRRRDVDVLEQEREGEALWIADTLADAGRPIDSDDVLEVLRLHADYPPQPEVVLRVARFERDRFLEVADRAVRVTSTERQPTEVVLCLRVFRAALRDLLKRGLRFDSLPLLEKRNG